MKPQYVVYNPTGNNIDHIQSLCNLSLTQVFFFFGNHYLKKVIFQLNQTKI